jgi:hypothetical protein
MRATWTSFASVLFAALAMAPALAHLLELPNKIGLPRDAYLTVQQIYRGWALLGIVVYGAIFSALAHVIAVRKERRAFVFAALGLACLLGTQMIFWPFTFPANQATQNWTMLPDGWEALRAQWEYSHAASALLNVGAFIALVLSVLAREK